MLTISYGKYLETEILKHILVKKIASVIIYDSYCTRRMMSVWWKKNTVRESLGTEAMRRLEPQ